VSRPDRPDSGDLRNRRSQVRILTGALQGSEEGVHSQGLHPCCAPREYLARKVVSDSCRFFGDVSCGRPKASAWSRRLARIRDRVEARERQQVGHEFTGSTRRQFGLRWWLNRLLGAEAVLFP
jgi:hypothetical protein